MKFLLIAYFLSSGQYTQEFATLDDCENVMIEAQIVKGPDLWTAVCVGPQDEVLISMQRDLGP